MMPRSPSPTNALELCNAAPLPNNPELSSPSATSGSFQSTDTDHVQQNTEPEDEYTLIAYGDIQEDEVIAPPPPVLALSTNPSPLQSRFPQPRLRLRVRRPPTQKRRISYIHVPDPKWSAVAKDHDERWPAVKVIDQPLASPVREHPTTTKERKSTKKSGSSLEKLFDELLPCPPSIRLSPPGSPANRVPQGTHEQNARKGEDQRVQEADKAMKSPQSSPTPASPQGKPKSAAWRTRLPPRPPIPKWDM